MPVRSRFPFLVISSSLSEIECQGVRKTDPFVALPEKMFLLSPTLKAHFDGDNCDRRVRAYPYVRSFVSEGVASM